MGCIGGAILFVMVMAYPPLIIVLLVICMIIFLGNALGGK